MTSAAQAEFWLDVQNCVAVVLSLSDPGLMATLGCPEKLFPFGSRKDANDIKRIISPSLLYGTDTHQQGAHLHSKGAAARAPSSASTVRSGYSRTDAETPRPSAPGSPARTIDLIRARPLVSPPTEPKKDRKKAPPPSPVKKQKPAPWATSQPAHSNATPSGTSAGGSYLDRYIASHPETVVRSSSPHSTADVGSPTPTKPSLKQPAKRGGIVIPYAHDEEPSASPPESDEDAPSVNLPKSAIRHVQRPTAINRGSGSVSPASVGASSVASSRQSSMWKPISTQMQRAAASGSNSTPLGQRNTYATGSKLGDRIHGFKVRQA